MRKIFYLTLCMVLLAFWIEAQHFNQGFNLGNRKPFNLTNSNKTVYEVTKDKQSNLYIAGFFKDSLRLKDSLYINPDTTNRSYLAKIKPNGKKAWINFLKGPINKKSLSAEFHNGQVYLSATFWNTIRFKQQALRANSDLGFVFTAFNPDGSIKSFQKVGGIRNYDGILSDFTFDQADNIIFCGSIVNKGTKGSLYFLQDSLKGTIFMSGFMAKVNQSGGLKWLKRYNPIDTTISFAGRNSLRISAITVDDQNDIGFSGLLDGRLRIDDDTVVSRGFNTQSNPDDMLVGKVASNGELLWANTEGTKYRTSFSASDVACAGNNTIIMGGGYGLYGYASNGNLLFGKPMTGDAKTSTISTDPQGNFYAGGSFKDKLSLYSFRDTHTIKVGFGRDYEGFLFKGDPLGDIQWLTNFGSPGRDFVTSLTTDSFQSHLAGIFHGERFFAPNLDSLYSKKGKDFILNIGNKDCDQLSYQPVFDVSDTICQYDSISLSVKHQKSAIRKTYWSIGETTLNSEDTGVKISDTGQTPITLTRVTKSGCRVDTSQSILVEPTPQSSFGFSKLGNGKVRFSPVDSTYAYYQWFFGDGLQKEVKNPKHQYAQNGNYEVRLKTRIDSCLAIEKDQITINSASGVHPHDYPLLDSVGIFPNPANDYVKISIRTLTSGRLKVSLLNNQGKVIQKVYNGKLKQDNHTLALDDITHLPSGVYHLKIQFEGEIVNKPITID